MIKAERKEVSAMTNIYIREMAKRANVKLWQIANELGLSDTTFSKKLRKELSDEEKRKIIFIIKKLDDTEF